MQRACGADRMAVSGGVAGSTKTEACRRPEDRARSNFPASAGSALMTKVRLMATLAAECLGELCIGYAPQRGNGRATPRRQQQGEGFPLADLCAAALAFCAPPIGSCGKGASGAATRVRLLWASPEEAWRGQRRCGNRSREDDERQPGPHRQDRSPALRPALSIPAGRRP